MASIFRKTGVAGLFLMVVLAAGGVSAAARLRETVANPGSIEGNPTSDDAINEYRVKSYVSISALGQGNPADDGQAEARREAQRAAEAETNLSIRDHTTIPQPHIAITTPLFIGVDDSALYTYLIDPGTGQEHPLFDGLEVWGAAYDEENQIVYIASGALLYRWPTNAIPGLAGTVKSATTNANLSITGLAFYDDTLYGLHPINSVSDDPKGVYIINPATAIASLYTEFDAPSDQMDMGGLAIDPATGKLYATNDAPALRGLVTIESDGTVTVKAPYPAGQVDIDGLAIGNGRAYLVTDEPGDIYAINLSTMVYEAPIDNPWTTPELFAGATWLGDTGSLTPSIAAKKTVGTDPNACAIESQVTVSLGTHVTYCYEVTNVGGVALSRHTLEDSELGTILDEFAYSLAPGASAFITATATINQTTVSSATWTAFNPGPTDVVWAMATARVSVTDDPPPPPCYSLDLSHTGSGSNPTVSPLQSIGCDRGHYLAGEVINLTAFPASGWRVKNWSGTNNDASTAATISLTMPAANHTASVTYESIPGTTFRAFTPAILDVPQTCLSGPNEAEPNNTAAAANGPLCNGSIYKGRPNDEYDIFYVDLKRPGDITVTMSNHHSPDVQLALHYQAISSNALDIDANGSDGFSVGKTNGQPGRYFIVIYVLKQHTGSTAQYSLRATFTE